jgi:RND family efflux transporter MFP subunit
VTLQTRYSADPSPFVGQDGRLYVTTTHDEVDAEMRDRESISVLNHVRLTRVPASIARFRNLETLALHHCSIVECRAIFPASLRSLSITNSMLEVFEPEYLNLATLAVLDAPEVDQALAQADADYQTALANQRLAATTARRWTQLLTQDAVSKQETDEKQGDLAAKSALANSALANVKRLRAMQGFERVLAPFDGVVTSRAAQIGALVVTGNLNAQPLFTVADVHRMRIYVHVPQNYSAMLRVGTAATLELPEYPGRTFNAELVRTAGAVDAQSGSVLVELQADNTDRQLKPGAFAQVHFRGSGNVGTMALPGTAILYGTDGPSVAVVSNNGQVVLRPIKIIRDEGNVVRVTGAISTGDAVIDTPPDAIHTGQHVRVTQVMPTGSAAKAPAHAK